MNEVSVKSLLTGYCMHPQVMSIRDGSWRPVAFPALAMLLVHPVEGPMLFDTGYSEHFLEATKHFPERVYRWTTPLKLMPGAAAELQVKRAGYDPLDVRHVIISHFHADHISGLAAFPNAVFHCARAGFEQICSEGRFSRVRRGLLQTLLPLDFATRARFFEDGSGVNLNTAYAPFEHGVDLLGDGSVLAVELPGHCPGHWGLAVNNIHQPGHLLVADAAWSLDAIKRNVSPPAFTTAFLGNTVKARETLRKLHTLSKSNPGLRITPCHCPERAKEAQQ